MKLTKEYKHQFIMYLTVFIVPIITMTTLYLYDDYINSRKITADYNLGLLTQFNNEIDLYISELQNYALSLSNDAHALQTDPINISNDTEILALLNTFKDNLSEDITPAYYPRLGQSIVIDDSIITYNEFEKSNYYQFSLSLSGLFVKLNNVNRQYILSLDKSSDEPSPYSYSTAILYPIPLIDAHPKGTLCFLIRSQFFIDIQEKYFSHMTSEISILDGKHSILYKDDSSNFTQADLSSYIKNNQIGISNIMVGGKKYVLMRTVSPTTGCNYLSMTPYLEFYSQGKQNVNLFFILVFLLIIFSILMAITLTRRFIFSVVNVESKNKEITFELNNRNTLIREMVLRRILLGNISDGDSKMMSYSLQCANIEFQYPYFTVAVCQINNFLIDDELYDRAIDRLANAIFPNGSCNPIKLPEDNQIALIVNSMEETDLQALVSDFMYQICSPLFAEDYIIGCGSTHPSCYKIDTSYIEANVAIEKRTSKTNTDCYLFDNRFDTTNQEFAYPHLEHALIEQSVRNGNTQTALQSLYNIFTNIDKMAPSMLLRQCLNYDVINMVAKIAQSIGIPLTSREIANLSTYNTFDELHKKIEASIISLTEKAIEQKNQQLTNTKYSLIDFVQNHYKENSMSLDLLASHFNLSYSYISKIFKDETSQTFSAYITELRFNYVKQKLTQTSLPIKDIISDSGYIDAANFMRKFKQNEGITLGQYRELYQQKNLGTNKY
ncbi:MAG: AraC family transcriptional regulator [Herbinix sp.]|nr:AraC family transcriptional regulator [Herbinix sp.]